MVNIHMASTDWLSQGTLVLASNNKGKIAEFKKCLPSLIFLLKSIPQGQVEH